jgi:hypothetical protein
MKFDLILKGTKEFFPGLNNKTYYVLKVDSPGKIQWTSNFFIQFITNAKLNQTKHYLGIDFEFNKIGKGDRDVALMQINLESDDSNEGYIIVIYPPELPSEDLDILIKLICEPIIIKILHGAESLDIPYMFNQLVKNNKLIDGLCTNFYDTKFLCDYSHISKKKQGRCSIYYLLTENNVITQEKFDELENIENLTGPIYLIHIDIHSMSHDVFRYSLYDVLYLPELIKKYVVKGIEYNKIIPQITCLINKYKRNIEPDFYVFEKIINTLNINYIYDSDSNSTILLNEIWEFYYYTISDKLGYLNNIKEIPNFKHFFEIITKMIIYSHVIKILKVQKTKKETIHLREDYLMRLFIWLNKYPEINSLMKEYSQIVLTDINKIVESLTKKN